LRCLNRAGNLDGKSQVSPACPTGIRTYVRLTYRPWGLGKRTIRPTPGRSPHRWRSAPSCSASTRPPSNGPHQTSSPTSESTAPRSGASCSLSDGFALRHTAGFEVATSAADGVRQSTAKPPPHCRSRREVRPSSGPECDADAGSVGSDTRKETPARRPLAQLLPRRVVGHPGAGHQEDP
jgi:hypothetical protein